MTDKVSTDAAKNGLLHRLMGHIAKSATPAELAELLNDTVAKGEAVSPQLSHAIDDQWTGSKGTEVGTNLEIGGEVKSKGNEPTKIISVYSPDQAAQMGATADATRLGEMINGLNSICKAVDAIAHDHVLMKSLLIKLAKAEPEKEEKKEDKKEDDKEDGEFGKAVNAILAKAEPLVAQAQERIVTAKSMAAEGFADQAGFARFGAAEFIVKAKKLIEAAKAMDPTNAKVVAIAKAMDDMKDEFGNKEADKKEETAKAVTVEETAKAAPALAMSPEHVAYVGALANELNIAKSTVSELMDTLSRRPMEVAKGKPELPISSQTTTVDGIQAIIRAKEESGELTNSEAAVAMDLSVLREADLTGRAPKGLYDAKRAMMPTAVKAIFTEAA